MLLRTIVSDQIRLLTFRQIKPDLDRNWVGYLAYGLIVTWLTGVGRYWDNPRAELWQYFGGGSVAYVFSLAAVLWLLIAPLKPRNWSYRNVLIFVMFTSLPALLYAIPVEKHFPLRTAASINVWFLAIVATWRVALLVQFLRKAAGLSGGTVVIATLLPLALIVCTLAVLNLEHVVFRIMAGVSPEERSANDGAYFILILITWFSFLVERFKNPDAMDWHGGEANQFFAFFDCAIKAVWKSIGDWFVNALCRRMVL